MSLIVCILAFAGSGSAHTPRHPDAPQALGRAGEGATPISIPLDDGTTLVADLYLPDGAGPHPVVLEVTPYPFISINPSTGNDIATDTAPPRPARITIRHGASYPSALTFEILASRGQPER